MTIVYGYFAIFAYIFVLIFGIGSVIKKRTSTETSRKIIHISLFLVWVLIDIFLKNTIHQIIIPICFLILNSLSYKLKLFKSIEREKENHYGTIYFAIAITIIMSVAYIYPVLYPYSGVAVFALTFGDGFAALVGHHTKSPLIYKNKSILGFVSCFAATFLSVLAFKFIYKLEITILNIAVLAIICAILELVSYGLDNFSITLPIMLISYFLSTSSDFWFYGSIYIALAIFGVVFFTKAIDYLGSLLSAFMVFCFSFYGGYMALIFLLACYFAIFAISKIAKKIKSKKEKVSRNAVQIAVNGGFGTLFVVLHFVYDSKIMLITALVSIAGCFVDSVSSDIGTLSKRKPYDFILRKHVETGISGGVSVLGTASALIASVACAIAIYFICSLKAVDILILTLIIFAQTVVDTILGSTIQEKLTCGDCGKITEKRKHCGIRAVHTRGIPYLDNNMVNLISAFAIALLSMIVYGL